MKSSLLVLSSALSSKTFQIQTARQHLIDLEACYSDLEQRLQGREQRLEHKARLTEEQKNQHNTQQTLTKSQLKRWEEDLSEAEKAHCEAEQALESVRKANKEIESRRDRASAEGMRVDGDLKGVKAALHTSLSREVTVKTDVSDLREKLQTGRTLLDAEKGRLRELMTKKDLLSDERGVKERKLAEVCMETAKSRSEFEAKQRELTRKLSLLRSKNDDLDRELSTMLTNRQETEREIRGNLEDVEQLCEELDEKTKELAAGKKKTRGLEEDIDVTREEITRKESQIDVIRKEVEATETHNCESSRLIEKYRSELQIRTQEFREKEHALLATEERIHATDAQIAHRREVLTSTFAQISHESEAVRIALESLQQRKTALAAEEFALKGQMMEMENGELIGTNKLQFDSVRELKGEMVGITESTLKRKHGEMLRVLEEEAQRLTTKEAELQARELKQRRKTRPLK